MSLPMFQPGHVRIFNFFLRARDPEKWPTKTGLHLDLVRLLLKYIFYVKKAVVPPPPSLLGCVRGLPRPLRRTVKNMLIVRRVISRFDHLSEKKKNTN